MILRGTYIKCVFFDAEIGQASFLVKPSDKIEQDKMLDNGLVKVVGRFCLQQKYMPLFLTGDWKNSEYGPEFAMYDACETALGERDEIHCRPAHTAFPEGNKKDIICGKQ